MRPPVVILALIVALMAPGPAGAAGVPVLVIEGHGHGHGVGMAQDGVLFMGKSGSTTSQILSQFYPGTTTGRAGGEVRVGVLTSSSNALTLRFPNGGEVRDAREGSQSGGFPVRLAPGGVVRLRVDGRRYAAEIVSGAAAVATAPIEVAAPAAAQPTTTVTPAPTTTVPPQGLLPLLTLPTGPLLPPLLATPTTTAPAPATPAPTPAPRLRAESERSLWAIPNGGSTTDVGERAARYRGVLEAVAGGGLHLVNHVDVEQYLRGMGEVRNPSWPAASLRAQAIAARTYALRAVASGGELCASQRCQVYLGAQAEYAAMDKAVAATRGQVLYFRKALAATVYSANGGGYSASTDEGFGTSGTNYPYLRSATYPTDDPGQWTVSVALRDVAARVGYRGKVTAVRTQAGPSGRAVQVVIEGSAGARAVSGVAFDKALGLRSGRFTVRVDNAAAPPPPPPAPGDDVVQLLPGSEASAGTLEVGASTPEPGPSQVAAATSRVLRSTPASSSPNRAAKVALGALAWLLLLAVAGMGAVTHTGTPDTTRRRPAPVAPTPTGDS